MDFNIITGLDPVYLNVGLMKLRRGLPLVAGKEKLGGWAFLKNSLTFVHSEC